MAQKKGKRTLITTLSILFVLLVAIGTIALVQVMNSNESDPYLQETSSTSDSEASTDQNEATDQPAQSEPTDEEEPDVTSANDDEASPTLDPATVNSIDIPPMNIAVSYVKGVGGFEYEVLRANNGTRYVEFRNENLIGTKCTNDQGTFASIIASPTESESVTLAKTHEVDGETYGLSLADGTCTGDTTLLRDYQKSFSDAFTLLKKID